jgi:hypothetical protein
MRVGKVFWVSPFDLKPPRNSPGKRFGSVAKLLIQITPTSAKKLG